MQMIQSLWLIHGVRLDIDRSVCAQFRRQKCNFDMSFSSSNMHCWWESAFWTVHQCDCRCDELLKINRISWTSYEQHGAKWIQNADKESLRDYKTIRSHCRQIRIQILTMMLHTENSGTMFDKWCMIYSQNRAYDTTKMCDQWNGSYNQKYFINYT